MNPNYLLVARRAGHRCEYCHAPEAVFSFPFEVEHVIPSSREGADDESNLALACRSCNARKSDCITVLDDSTVTEVNLFNPREDRWEDHFVALETGIIEGLTPVGRGTVVRLQFNNHLQTEARGLWMRLGLFP